MRPPLQRFYTEQAHRKRVEAEKRRVENELANIKRDYALLSKCFALVSEQVHGGLITKCSMNLLDQFDVSPAAVWEDPRKRVVNVGFSRKTFRWGERIQKP